MERAAKEAAAAKAKAAAKPAEPVKAAEPAKPAPTPAAPKPTPTPAASTPPPAVPKTMPSEPFDPWAKLVPARPLTPASQTGSGTEQCACSEAASHAADPAAA